MEADVEASVETEERMAAEQAAAREREAQFAAMAAIAARKAQEQEQAAELEAERLQALREVSTPCGAPAAAGCAAPGPFCPMHAAELQVVRDWGKPCVCQSRSTLTDAWLASVAGCAGTRSLHQCWALVGPLHCDCVQMDWAMACMSWALAVIARQPGARCACPVHVT